MMNICPVCNNDSFDYKYVAGDRMAICTLCKEDFFDDDDTEEYDDDEC